MPQADLHCSPDLDLDAEGLLATIEAIIHRHDDGAGACKGRAYLADAAHHTSVKLTVAMLAKPHRGAQFVAALQDDIWQTLAAELPRPCWLSVDITFSGTGYRTEHLT